MMLDNRMSRKSKEIFCTQEHLLFDERKKNKKLYILPKIETFRAMLETSTNMW